MLPNEVFALACRERYAEDGLVVDESNGEFAHCPLPRSMGDSGYYLLHDDHQWQGLLQSRDVGRQCYFSGHVTNWLIRANFVDGWFDLWDIYNTFTGNPLRITFPDGRIVLAYSVQYASELTNLTPGVIETLIKHPPVNFTYPRLNLAYTYAPTPVYWPADNPSKPKPVLIHYPDKTITYAESIKHAARVTNVTQSTVQRRLMKTIHEQQNELWIPRCVQQCNRIVPLFEVLPIYESSCILS